MNYAGMLSGGAPIKKRVRIASGTSAITVPGGIVTGSVANGTGVVFGLTTAIANQVGVYLDTAIAGTTSPANDTNALLTVIINPDAIYRIRMCNSATSGTALVISTGTDTSKTANVMTAGDPDPAGPEKDEGTIIAIGGVNVGQMRKITSTATTVTATHIEGWVNTPVAGDRYLLVPWTPFATTSGGAGSKINLTTDLTEGREDISVGTGQYFRILDLDVDFSSPSNAQRGSYIIAMLGDVVTAQSVTAVA
jgi:hypothetical protein